MGFVSGNGSTGEENTFIGSFAGNATGSGSRNVYIGVSAGINNDGGEGNVLIGSGVGSILLQQQQFLTN